MRLGVFGGTFDPVHLGHLILAEQCREQAGLDRVLFVLAPRPPHKLDRPLTPFHQRAEMLHLALAGNPSFQVEEMEKDRAGPSFTVHTLEELHRRHPEAELALMLGSDSLKDLSLWYEPRRIAEMARLVIVTRPGHAIPPENELRAGLGLAANFSLRMDVVNNPLIGISSSDLRRRVAEGKSVRYQVPRAVEVYVREKQLYRS